MIILKTFLLVVMLVFSVTTFAVPDYTDGLREGEVSLIPIGPKSTISSWESLRVKIFNLFFPVFPIEEGSNKLYALVSAPLGVMPGTFNMDLMASNQVLEPTDIKVESRGLGDTEEVLEVDALNVLPSDRKIVERIAMEDLEKKNVLSGWTPQRQWKLPFLRPLDTKITSPFGIYRIYSKHHRRRTHWGVDFKAPIGTPVKSSADGTVVMAKELYFPGKTIIVDHGLGLYIGYSHLKSMKVSVGDKVKAGQIIGLTGISGKVTGPHLHWFAVNSKVKFDPLKLLEIKNP